MQIARIFEFEPIHRLEDLLKVIRELGFDESVQSPKLSGILLQFEVGLFRIQKETSYSEKYDSAPPVVYRPRSEAEIDNTSRWYLRKYEVSEDSAQVTKLADLEIFLYSCELDLYYFRTSTTIYSIIPVKREKSIFQTDTSKPQALET